MMKTNNRFIHSVVRTATKSEVEMPWARGQRRKSFVTLRKASARLDKRTA